MKKIEALLGKLQTNSAHAVGDYITMADLSIFQMIYQFQDSVVGFTGYEARCPKSVAIYENVMSNEIVRKYIEEVGHLPFTMMGKMY
jgi:hypothetical protein